MGSFEALEMESRKRVTNEVEMLKTKAEKITRNTLGILILNEAESSGKLEVRIS